ncbi:acetyl-CoA synthetase-like protein [Cutaneotrichosporon oleaginosum]|uniref:Acetyl-CoA synthetase-like protein n=1 Tax=Cutaneotrichosporon oleaginosum TaxID=879819 RepID=A0A0J0XH86_9TREE|nr:acetyl-CoA synthetase-like protein [Cutaneotrichosporon oleaginosum]KLT40423.1 acetyl-CoA synthetase-like protein [Cutaneotrichosporon oleaginosum]TXT11388.1 hypothetical protein COLE_01798 [Cutaneotrichosporon oleaginosum]
MSSPSPSSPSPQAIIFESPYPQPFLPNSSVFHYLFPDIVGASPLPPLDPALPAYIDGLDGRVLSRADVVDGALRLATGVRGLGAKRGDVALLWGLNSLEWARAIYGCFAAGLTVSPANGGYSAREIAHQINDSGASILFICPTLLPVLEEARPLLKRAFPAERVVLLARETVPAARAHLTVGDLLTSEPGHAERFDGVDAHSTAIMCYSSGTTGLAKGVETTHHNLTSELQALNAGSRQLVSGVDVILGVLPFSHIYGLGMNFLQPAAKGCPVVVLPRFNEIPALEAIQKYKITHALIVPPIVVTFLNSKHVPNYDLSSLKTVVSGAAPLGGEIAAAFAKLIPGVVMLQAYGNTETSPVVMTAHADEFASTPGSVATCGKLLPTYQARIVAEGRDVGVGERGELWVRGPTIMKGYLNNPGATAAAVLPGGWYRTGDVVVVNADGWYAVVDRVKELIKYKGFQVPPAELEALLLQHPQVVDAGVIGIYDSAQATELPRAYVVASEKLDARRQAALGKHVAEWVAAKVANHKKLRGGVRVVDAIPKSAAGKILRKELRLLAEAEAPKAEARL